MDFNLTDEQQLLSESLTRLLGDHCNFETRRAIAASQAGWSFELWQRLADLGITALGIPESCGGLGGGAVDRLPVAQAFGRALLLEPYLASAVLGTAAFKSCGSAAQQDALLPRLASGELRLAWAHDEAAGGHQPLWIETRARHDGKRWLLNGAKSLVVHAAAAHRFVVSARLQGVADDANGIALFLVDAGSAGANLRTYRMIDDTPAGELVLDGAVAESVPLV
jgi:alkylation response protein AidB-like acyl-CoA dehydrogenase